MISVCASCSKCVYPTEKVTCFDRPWHKFCFKCQECGMVLNMKNYKGYEKKPYCLAHYPTVRYTQVAETPEHKRLKENSNVLSKAKYQADFQKQKGTKISVSDDVTNEKLKQLKSFQSQTQYQKQFKKEIIGSKTSVPDDVVTNQLKKAQENMSVVRYHKEFNEQIKGTLLSTTEDIKSAYLKDLQNLNDSKYHEDYQKHIRGKKMSLADDIMTSYLKETQSRITSIGYRQRTVSVESTKRKSVVSVDSVDSSVFLDSEAEPGSVEVVEAAEGSTAYNPSESIEQLEAGDEVCGTENEIGQENAQTDNLYDETNSDNKFAKSSVEESGTQSQTSAQAEQIGEEYADTTDSGISNAAECDDAIAPLSNDMISSHREADDSVEDCREEVETSAVMAPNLEESGSDPTDEIKIKSPETNETEVIPSSISDSSSTDLEPGEVPMMTLASSEPQQDLSRDSHVSELASSITQMIDELFEDPPAPHSSDEDLVFSPESSREDDVLGELEQTRETRSYSTPTDFSTPDRERHNLGSFTSDPGSNSVMHYEAEGNTSSVDSADLRPSFLSEASPYSISVGKLKKIKKLSDSINVFRTTLTHGALSRLIKED